MADQWGDRRGRGYLFNRWMRETEPLQVVLREPLSEVPQVRGPARREVPCPADRDTRGAVLAPSGQERADTGAPTRPRPLLVVDHHREH